MLPHQPQPPLQTCPLTPEVSGNTITPPETPESCSSSTRDPGSLLAASVPKGAGTCRWSEFSRGQAAETMQMLNASEQGPSRCCRECSSHTEKAQMQTFNSHCYCQR